MRHTGRVSEPMTARGPESAHGTPGTGSFTSGAARAPAPTLAPFALTIKGLESRSALLWAAGPADPCHIRSLNVPPPSPLCRRVALSENPRDTGVDLFLVSENAIVSPGPTEEPCFQAVLGEPYDKVSERIKSSPNTHSFSTDVRP